MLIYYQSIPICKDYVLKTISRINEKLGTVVSKSEEKLLDQIKALDILITNNSILENN